jgi:predicted PurR-regulated permease PerM
MYRFWYIAQKLGNTAAIPHTSITPFSDSANGMRIARYTSLIASGNARRYHRIMPTPVASVVLMQKPEYVGGSREKSRPLYRNLQETQIHLWEIPALRELFLLVLSGLLFWLLYSLRGIFIPLFLAVVLAHIFNPFVTLLEEKWRWPRPLIIVLLLGVFIFTLCGLIWWLAPILLEQSTGFARDLPNYVRTLAATFNVELGDLSKQLEQSIRQFQQEPKQIIAQILKTTNRAVGIMVAIFGIAAGWILSIVLVLVYFFFFSWHFNNGLDKLKQYIPVNHRERTCEIVSRMDGAVGQFFRGRLLIAIIMGFALSAGWFLTDVPYWFFLGMLTGLLNIVPYVSFVGWPIAIALKYAVDATGGESPGLLAVIVWPSAVYVGVQLLEGWVLTPWVQSGQTDLSAATVLLVVIIGGAAITGYRSLLPFSSDA